MDYLIKFFTKARACGNKIILAVDTNEHAFEGKFLRELKQIVLTEALHRSFKIASQTSCDRGSLKI